MRWFDKLPEKERKRILMNIVHGQEAICTTPDGRNIQLISTKELRARNKENEVSIVQTWLSQMERFNIWISKIFKMAKNIFKMHKV